MSRFELVVTWLGAPGVDEAFGPERATWAELEVMVDGECVTTNHPADLPGVESGSVVGGMSGLAEWVVDAWMPLRFEVLTPFPKVDSFRRDRRTFPTARDAYQGWSRFMEPQLAHSGGALASWQQRHTFGSAASDLALPSLVLVPEDSWIGLVADHPPAALDPSVRFTPPGRPDSWPGLPRWLPAQAVVDGLDAFVGAVMERAATDPEGATWATWLRQRWDVARADAEDPGVVRRWRYGGLVAERWSEVNRRLGTTMPVFEGLLADCPVISERETLDALVDTLRVDSGGPTGSSTLPGNVNWNLPHYVEGYRLAQEVRDWSGFGARALGDRDLTEIVARAGLELREIRAHGLFRSAVWAHSEGGVLGWAGDDPFLQPPGPRRFAIAAALGRLMASGALGLPRGAAHGMHSRVRPSQLANAFAAELLLPIQAIDRGSSIPKLARAFGMSTTAVEWHVHNRLPMPGA